MLEKTFWFLNNLTKSGLSTLKIIVLSKYFNSVKKAENTKKVIILGTGPSFSHTYSNHLTYLKNTDTIGLNHFATKDEFSVIKPNLYVIGAPELWDETLSESYVTRAIKLYRTITNITEWKMTLMLGINAKNTSYVKLLRTNPNITVEYYNRTPVDGLSFFNHLFFSMKLGMPRPHNVMIPCIMISIWKGYKKIYLVGADHSWHEQIRVDNDNAVILNQEHYYDKKENWRQMHMAGTRWRLIHEVFDKFRLAFYGYHVIKKYGDSKDIYIFNASKKSYIDAFPRVELEQKK